LARKKKTFDVRKEVRAIARERVGTVPPVSVIPAKSVRDKVKHKKRATEEQE
jgi:hypothetical protein